MTLRPEDVLRLPCPGPVLKAAVSAACREKPLPTAPPSIRSLRRRAACLAAELSLRRWLDQHQLPYDLRLDTPLTAPEHPQLYLGGRRVRVHLFLPRGAAAAERLHRQPHRLLTVPLPRPESEPDGLPLAPPDLLVFVTLIGFPVPLSALAPQASHSSPPTTRLASPPEWFRTHLLRCPAVELRYDGQHSLDLHLIAWIGPRPVTHRLALPPQQAVLVSGEVGRVVWLQTSQSPDGALQMTSSAGLRWRLSPGRWHALPLPSAEVLLAGWCTCRELEARLQRAQVAGQSTPWRELRPLSDLATRLRRRLPAP